MLGDDKAIEEDDEGSEISLDDADLDELDDKAGRPKGSGGDADSEDISPGGGGAPATLGGGMLLGSCFYVFRLMCEGKQCQYPPFCEVPPM